MKLKYHLSNLVRGRFSVCAFAAFFFPMLSLSAFDLYWTEQKKIIASDIDGSNVEVIFDGELSSPQMSGFIVDIAVADSHIYWSGHDGNDIWRANRDGTDAVQLIPYAGESIHFLALNEAEEILYFSDFGNGLGQVDLSQGFAELRDWNSHAYTGIAMANENPQQLFAVTATDSDLYRFSPDSYVTESVETLPNGSATYGLAYDADAGNIYYTNFTDNSLNVYNLDSKEHEKFWTPEMVQPLGLKMSPSGTHLLIAERGRGISAFQIDTKAYQLIVEAEEAHFGVAVTTDPADLGEPPAPPGDGFVLWSTDFENDAEGAVPGFGWSKVTGPDQGEVYVMTDEEDIFGFGTENKFLRIDQAVNFRPTGDSFLFPAEVVTFSFDFIGRSKEGDGRWFQAIIYGDDYAHITSVRLVDQDIRQAPGEPAYGENDRPLRMETILNNSPETISYEGPDGKTYEIASTEASIWVYDHEEKLWNQLVESYSYNRVITETGPVLTHAAFMVDGNAATRTFDLDNVEVRLGAALSDLEGDVYEPPPPPVPEDGEVLWAVDFESDAVGNQPDEANGWSDFPDPESGTAVVAVDSENEFGFGDSNQFLRATQVRDFRFKSDEFWTPVDLLTLSFDYIARYNPGDGRWINIWIGAGSSRVHITSIRTQEEPALRPSGDPSIGDLDVPIRVETIMNNSEERVLYRDPKGRLHGLESEQATVWIYHYTTQTWEQVFESYNYSNQVDQTGPLMESITFDIDGRDETRTFDIDNIKVVYGAHLSDLEGEIDLPPFLGHLDVDFEGIPTGELTSENSKTFLHGNLSRFGFHSVYREPGAPQLTIEKDEENRFGRGSENQVLRTNKAAGWQLHGENNFDADVMTLRIDMIAGSVGGGRLTSRFFDSDGGIVSRIEFGATDAETGDFQGGAAENSGSWEYGAVNRFEAVFNNSFEEISYTAPCGIEKTLGSGKTDLWVNGELAFSDSEDGRDGRLGRISSYSLLTFSTNPWDAEIDLIRTYEGVELVPVEFSGSNFADWISDHFENEDDPSIIGAEADPDGDGIPNLLEYALGLDPNNPDRSGLPLHSIATFEVDGNSNEYLTLSVTSPDSVTDVDFEVLATSDLGGWPDHAILESAISNGDGTTTRRYRDPEPIDSSARRFLQLEVELTD